MRWVYGKPPWVFPVLLFGPPAVVEMITLWLSRSLVWSLVSGFTALVAWFFTLILLDVWRERRG